MLVTIMFSWFYYVGCFVFKFRPQQLVHYHADAFFFTLSVASHLCFFYLFLPAEIVKKMAVSFFEFNSETSKNAIKNVSVFCLGVGHRKISGFWGVSGFEIGLRRS